MTDEAPQVEDIADEEMPGLQNADGGAEGGDGDDDDAVRSAPKQSRAEKKARKAMGRLGMKPVSGINRVTLLKSQSILFAISEPDVYRLPGQNSYVVFGNAKIEDLSQNQMFKAAEQLKGMPQAGQGPAGMAAAAAEAAADAGAGDDDDQPPPLTSDTGDAAAAATTTPGTVADEAKPDANEDLGNLEEKDIALVMQQVDCTRAQAIAALKKSDGDIVNAIMDLQFV